MTEQLGPGRRHVLRQWVQRAGLPAHMDLLLLDRALTNRSAANERLAPADNERLEFLGDACIGLVVAEELAGAHPEWREGELTFARAAVVSAFALGQVARQLGLGRLLRVGHGEARARVRELDSVLSSTFEAVVAAVYLSLGYQPARLFVRRCLEPLLAAPPARCDGSGPGQRDYKSEWQEWAQHHLGRTPTYRVIATSGPPHRPWFEVETLVEGKPVAVGAGPSTKRAEQQAAGAALQQIATGRGIAGLENRSRRSERQQENSPLLSDN